MNIELATQLIRTLVTKGVYDFCVCAGARNAPLVKVLDAAAGIQLHSFFDERSAGFFALGRAKRDGRPVAVVTTSGTAVAELLPAAVEAHYSGVPIVLVSADRPRSHRGSASPQTIEQVGIFSHYAKPTYDIEAQFSDATFTLNMNGATHVNICFSEPLIDAPVPHLELRPTQMVSASDQSGRSLPPQRSTFFAKARKPLCVLGGLPVSARGHVLEFLIQLGAPVYAEAISGLREESRLAHLQIRSGLVTAENFREHFDSVLRIGSVPTLRLWRDLDGDLRDVPVLSFAPLAFSGLGRDAHVTALPLQDLFASPVSPVAASELPTRDRGALPRLDELVRAHPNSEPALVRGLSEHIEPEARIFLGNSLPIREWDLAASYRRGHSQVEANRGANGIDGLISTFMGWSDRGQKNYLVLGDLSALYDLNALALAGDSMGALRIVVINNSGGQIFARLFGDSRFLNSHQLKFDTWAEMFGFSYLRVSDPVNFTKLADLPDRAVVEVIPDLAQTTQFWQKWQLEGLGAKP